MSICLNRFKFVKLFFIIIFIILNGCNHHSTNNFSSKTSLVTVKVAELIVNNIYSKIVMKISASDIKDPIIIEKEGPFYSGDTITLEANVPEGKDRLIEIFVYDTDGKIAVYGSKTIDIFQKANVTLNLSNIKWQGQIRKKEEYLTNFNIKDAINLKYKIFSSHMLFPNFENKTDDTGATDVLWAGDYFCYFEIPNKEHCIFMPIDNIEQAGTIDYTAIDVKQLDIIAAPETPSVDSKIYGLDKLYDFTSNNSNLYLSTYSNYLVWDNDTQQDLASLVFLGCSKGRKECKILKKFNSALPILVDENYDLAFGCTNGDIFGNFLTLNGTIIDETGLFEVNKFNFQVWGKKLGLDNNIFLPLSFKYNIQFDYCGKFDYDNLTNTISYSIPYVIVDNNLEKKIDVFLYKLSYLTNSTEALGIFSDNCTYQIDINKESLDQLVKSDFNLISLGNFTLNDTNVDYINLCGFSNNGSIEITINATEELSFPKILVFSDKNIHPDNYTMKWHKTLNEKSEVWYTVTFNEQEEVVSPKLIFSTFNETLDSTNKKLYIYFETNYNATCNLELNSDNNSLYIDNIPSTEKYIVISNSTNIDFDNFSSFNIYFSCRTFDNNSVFYNEVQRHDVLP